MQWKNLLAVSLQLEAELVEVQVAVRGVRSHFPRTTVWPHTDRQTEREIRSMRKINNKYVPSKGIEKGNISLTEHGVDS